MRVTSVTSSLVVASGGSSSYSTFDTAAFEFKTVITTTYAYTGRISLTITTFSTSTTSLFESVSASAKPLYVIWEETDLPNFPPTYASSLAKRIGVSFTPAASPGSSPTLPSETNGVKINSSNPSNGLSTSAKAGIGVGVAVSSLMALALAALLILRRVRKRRNNDISSENFDVTPEIEDQDATLATRKWYLRGRWRSEVEAKNKPSELDAGGAETIERPPVELESSSVDEQQRNG